MRIELVGCRSASESWNRPPWFALPGESVSLQRPAILSTRKSIFVVEDDTSMRMSIKRLLREHGFSTLLFGSAAALIDHDDLDEAACLIIDINLNDQSGIALRRRLADGGVTAPVIYITGNDSPANRAAAIESGCTAYLTKPFTAHALIGSIQRACPGIG